MPTAVAAGSAAQRLRLPTVAGGNQNSPAQLLNPQPPTTPVQAPTGLASAGLSQTSAGAPKAPEPSQIATPPSPRQTPTGGATPTQPSANPLAVAATKAVTAQQPQRTSLITAGPATTPSATPPKVVGQSAQPQSGAPTGSPDPGMPNTSASVAAPVGGAGSWDGPTPGGGAAPLTPANSGSAYGIPLLPTDENTISGATATYGNSVAALNQGMYQAAEAYGDPTVEGQWGPSSVNPNSALALAALKAQEQTQATQNSLGKNDTLFSSIAGQDYNTIAGTQQRADLAGYQKYQAALAKFNAALAQASTTETSTIGGAQADERQNAINNLPTPDTATGSAAAGTNNAGTTTAGGIKTPKVGKGAKVSTTTKVKVPKASTGKTSVPKVSSRK